MTRFFKFSVAPFFLSALLLTEARGQKVSDVTYFPDGNRVILNYNISRSWIQLPHFLRRKVWVLPALDVPGQRLDFDTVKSVSGDVGFLGRPQPGPKFMVWDFSKDLNQLPPGSRLTAKLITNRLVRNRTYTRYFVAGWSGTLYTPYGLIFASYGLWGWYAGLSTTGLTNPNDIVDRTKGIYNGPFNNLSRNNSFSVATGLNRRLTKWDYLSLGIGIHGYSEMYKQNDYWLLAEYEGGISIDFGLTHRFNRFFVGARIGIIVSDFEFSSDNVFVPAFSLGYAIATKQVKRF